MTSYLIQPGSEQEPGFSFYPFLKILTMRHKPAVQRYEEYTEEDFAVWALLFDRQMAYLKDTASRLYLRSLDEIGFHAGAIPLFAETNKRLQQATGWQLVVARELVPQETFFALLARKIFPATCWLRTMSELDYLEEPDMFHDVFGHAPLLMQPDYAVFVEGFGKLALGCAHRPAALRLLSALYWFTIEFGLLQEQGQPRIFGAGILSSPGECRHAMHSETEKKTFDLSGMMHTQYRTDVLQERYFTIDSFEQLIHALPRIATLLDKAEEKLLAEYVP